ncbi:N-acetylneuraminate synthase family protein, partial [Mycobacterium tuberculosis]|nr:N-acetylneuraminate synthase family protein [Mycobacterium tuberculosis]
MKQNFSINNRPIGIDHAPYIIAEMSASYNGESLNLSSIIDMAKACAADAVKMQTYTADTITLNSSAADFQIHGGLWDGRTLYDLYQE